MFGRPGAKSPHEAYFYYRGARLEAVRCGKWKLRVVAARRRRRKKGEKAPKPQPPKAELYDLVADISETTNLAAKHPDVVRRDTHERFHAMYDARTLPLPKSFLPEHPFDNGELRVRDERLAFLPRTEQCVRRHLADYYAMITHADAAVGRVVEELKRTGAYDNTILVFAGDNGLNPFLAVDLEGDALQVNERTEVMVGDDGQRVGIILGGGGGYTAIEGKGTVRVGTPTIFGITVQNQGSVNGGVGEGAAMDFHAYWDREEQRFHLGGGLAGKVLGGLGLDGDISVGKPYEPDGPSGAGGAGGITNRIITGEMTVFIG